MTDIWFLGDPTPKPTAGDITRGAIERAINMGVRHYSRGDVGQDAPVANELKRWLGKAAGHEADTRGHVDAESYANGRAMPGWLYRDMRREQLRRNRYAKTMQRRQADEALA